MACVDRNQAHHRTWRHDGDTDATTTQQASRKIICLGDLPLLGGGTGGGEGALGDKECAAEHRSHQCVLQQRSRTFNMRLSVISQAVKQHLGLRLFAVEQRIYVRSKEFEMGNNNEDMP